MFFLNRCLYVKICFLYFVLISLPAPSRFPPVGELAPIGTSVGTILAAAVDQIIFYSIVSGNERGRWRPCAAGDPRQHLGLSRLAFMHPDSVRDFSFAWRLTFTHMIRAKSSTLCQGGLQHEKQVEDLFGSDGITIMLVLVRCVGGISRGVYVTFNRGLWDSFQGAMGSSAVPSCTLCFWVFIFFDCEW